MKQQIVFHDVSDETGKVTHFVCRELLDSHSGGMIMLRAEGRDYSYSLAEEP